MSSIVLTGLAANDAVPGSYVEVNFAQGAASLGTATYGALIIANKTSAGSATAGTVVYSQTSTPPLANESDAIALFGAGSPAHRMWRRFVKKNKLTPVSVICPAESGGAAATGVITWATNASAAGVTRVYVGEEYVERSITSGDTPTVTAAAVKALINAQTHWPVTADNIAGVLTITWKTAGPRGNYGRFSATISAGIGQTVTPSAVTNMFGGTTADSYTTSLATILPYRHYYIISESGYEGTRASSADVLASQASTQFTALMAQINTQAQPITGIRQRAFCGFIDTLALGTTFATGINNTRAEIVWSQNSDRPPEEVAADAVAIYALEERPTAFRCNFSGYGGDAKTQPNWDHPAPRDQTSPTRGNILSALNNGLTPIAVYATGATYLVKRITSRSLTSSIADYRIRDAHKVTVMDRFADDWNSKVVLQFSGKKIGNDPAQGARIPGPDVVTPRVLKAAFVKLLRDYEELDLIEDVADSIANMTTQRESSPTTRLSLRAPIDCIDIADQFASALDQTG